jgi:protein tyrosine phosphatase
LKLLDDPETYPVLLHCHAGLHRTGVMVAIYRMEYEGRSPAEAIQEMKANGFAEWPCTSANDYITQYVLTFRRGVRNPMETNLASRDGSSSAR